MAVHTSQMLAHLPPDAPDFGPLEEVYPKSSIDTFDRTPAGNFAMAAVALVVALVFLVVRLVAEPPADEGERQVFDGFLLGMMAVGGVLALICLVRALRLQRTSAAAVGRYWLVFRDGLMVLDGGNLVAGHPLSELRVTKRSAASATSVNSQARLAVKTAAKIDDALFPDLRLCDAKGQDVPVPADRRLAAPIIRHLHENIAGNLLPRAVERVKAGKQISFGAVAVRQDGLVCGGQLIPFANIAQIAFPGGTVMEVASQHGKPLARASLGKDIHNVWLFVQLIRTVHPAVIPEADSLKKTLV